MKNSATDKPKSHHQSSYETFNEPLMNFHFVPVTVLFFFMTFFFYTNCFFYPIIQITYISYNSIFFLLKITQFFIFFDSFSLNLLAIYVQNKRMFNHLCCDNNFNITMIAFKTFCFLYFQFIFIFTIFIIFKNIFFLFWFWTEFKKIECFFLRPLLKNESKIYD